MQEHQGSIEHKILRSTHQQVIALYVGGSWIVTPSEFTEKLESCTRLSVHAVFTAAQYADSTFVAGLMVKNTAASGDGGVTYEDVIYSSVMVLPMW